MSIIEIPPVPSTAVAAYDSLAESYDLLTEGYCHDLWIERIEEVVARHGVSGRTALDLACGTGKSFIPLLNRGYSVTACDISAKMAEIARRKALGAEVLVADIRQLDFIGEFDLITCLDDGVNYLLEESELVGLFRGISRNLAGSGVAVFDVNSRKLYREDFVRDWIIDTPSRFIAWTARADDPAARTQRYTAKIHMFSSAAGSWTRSLSTHEQRHWTREAVEKCAASASLQILDVLGQTRGAVLHDAFHEDEHDKGLYLLTHRERG